MSGSRFDKLALRDELLKNLDEIQYSEMTPIQAGCLPLIMEGRDVIGQAKTGSGKTAAFGLGMLNSLEVESLETQGLVLCPTRELAEQVALELRKLARKIPNVKVLTITGGVGYGRQQSSLEHGAHIIVGTPGRVAKLIKGGSIQLDRVKCFVLDEADRMLDMGFYEEIRGIERRVASDRQTLLFSATFPEEILDLSHTVQENAKQVIVDSLHQEGDIEQNFYLLESHKNKDEAVMKILGRHQPERLIIFCKTKILTEKLAKKLRSSGIQAECIHGDLDQNERTKVLTKFSNNSLTALVSTDVAARGLDIKDLPAVINYDLPMDPEDYVHRVGRTGRAGNKGLAFSLYVEAEQSKVDSIQEQIKQELVPLGLSDLGDGEFYDAYPPMETIFISGGKKDKLRPGDILGALVKDAGIEASNVGDINILPVLSYVAIKREWASQAIDKLSEGRIKKRKFRIGRI